MSKVQEYQFHQFMRRFCDGWDGKSTGKRVVRTDGVVLMTDADFMSVMEKGDGVIVVDHAALSKPGAMLRVEDRGVGAGAGDPTEQEIAAVSTAPRVTPADIEANISSEHYFTAKHGWAKAQEDEDPIGDWLDVPEPLGLLTFCVLVLRNGFTVTGESACASPENFDPEIGRRVARANAVQKLWPLMGYALKQDLYRAT